MWLILNAPLPIYKQIFMVKQTLSISVSDAQKPSGLAYLVGRLDHVLNKRLRDSLAPFGLTVPQYTALSMFRAQGSLSNAQLAERTMVTPQSANEMVKVMEARGWIERNPDQTHGRIIQISLTDEGHAILRQGDAEVLKVELIMFPDLQDQERTQLRAQLRAAVRAITLHDI
jgi:DNA-binding MarR family transcriptional regulator